MVGTKQELRERLWAFDSDLIFYDGAGYDEAITGISCLYDKETKKSHWVVTYSKDDIIEALKKDIGNYTDALEWYEYNVLGTYVGNNTPLFMGSPYCYEYGEQRFERTCELPSDNYITWDEFNQEAWSGDEFWQATWNHLSCFRDCGILFVPLEQVELIASVRNSIGDNDGND